MRTRKEAVQLAQQQIDYTHTCTRNKGNKVHYGVQELRELLDYIYGGPPGTSEILRSGHLVKARNV